MKSIEKYFLEEKDILNNLSKEFVKKHPALTGMLTSPSTDPDVERLLEGVAFLNAFLKRDIQSSYINIAKYVLQHALPSVTKPSVSSTVLKITPDEYLKEKVHIKKGTYFLSYFEDEEYKFQNRWEMDVYPLEYDVKSVDNKIIFSLKSSVKIEKLHFYINSDYDKKYTIFKYLYYCKKVYIKTNDTYKHTDLCLLGLEKNVYKNDDEINPFVLIYEYFNFIDKFFVFEIEVNEKECEVVFECDENIEMEINKDDISFFPLPVVNLFETDLDPIELDYKKECIVLNNYTKYEIYDIIEVIGYNGSERKIYTKFDLSANDKNVYEVYDKKILDKEEKCLVIHFNDVVVDKEVLSVKVLAYNKKSGELKRSSVTKPGDNTPELIKFKNITPVTPLVRNVEDENLWDVINYLNMTLNDIDSDEKIKKILKLFLNGNFNSKEVYKNLKKIESISSFNVKTANKVYKGTLIQGFKVYIELNGKNFLNNDEVFLFGLVIEYFLASLLHVNNFIQVIVTEKITGTEMICKAITGTKKLI
jgi:type VI secretion system protein ImpG